jgi:hypothetical protein
MSEVEVVRAAAADWQDVKLTRLRALADAPYAFASTLAREQMYDDEEWRRPWRTEPGSSPEPVAGASGSPRHTPGRPSRATSISSLCGWTATIVARGRQSGS